MFESLKKKSVENIVKGAIDRANEEQLYAQVVLEIENGQRRDGLWAKALVTSQGDENKAKAEYIKLRVQSIFDDEILRAVQQSEIDQAQAKRDGEAWRYEQAKRANEEKQARQKEFKEKEEASRKLREKENFWTYATTDRLRDKFESIGASIEKTTAGWKIILENGSVKYTVTRPGLEKIFEEASK